MDRIGKLKEFLLKDPEDSFLQHALAMEYVALGDDAAARRLWERVLEKDPSYIGSYYQLGRLLERAGDIGEAVECFAKGMQAARAGGDKKAYNELQAAHDELADL